METKEEVETVFKFRGMDPITTESWFTVRSTPPSAAIGSVCSSSKKSSVRGLFGNKQKVRGTVNAGRTTPPRNLAQARPLNSGNPSTPNIEILGFTQVYDKSVFSAKFTPNPSTTMDPKM